MISDLNKKSVEELKKLEEESRAELFALKFQSAMGNLEKPDRISKLKKQIARILTILSARRIAGENTTINVKIDLNETYAKIEKESQQFAKERKAKIEKMMAEQSDEGTGDLDLMNLSLDDAMGDLTIPSEDTTVSSAPAMEKTPKVAVKPAPKAALAKAAPKKDVKPAPVAKKPAKVEKPVAAKPAVEKTPKAETKPVAKTTSKTAEIKPAALKAKTAPAPKAAKVAAPAQPNAKEKLSELKNSLGSKTAVGRGTGVKIDLKTKDKDPNAEMYTYGTN